MKLDIEALKIALPCIADELVNMMINDALRIFQENDLSLEDAHPTVGIIIETPEGGSFRVSLSIGNQMDEESEDGNEEN